MAELKYIELSPDRNVPLIAVPKEFEKDQIDEYLKGAEVHQQLLDKNYLYAFGAEPVYLADPENLDDWDITRGAKAGYNSLKSIFAGAEAYFYDVFGMEEAQQEAIKQLKQYQLEAAKGSFTTDEEGNIVKAATTVEEILNSEDKLNSFMDWLLYNVGQGAVTTTPIILTGLLTGGVGAVAAGTAGRVAAGGWIKAATKGLGTGAITKRINPVSIGAMFAAQQMAVGDIYGEQTEKSDDPNAAIAFGLSIPYVAAEGAFGAGSILLRNIIKKVGKDSVAKTFKELSKGVGKNIVKSQAGEAAAEGIQEAIVQTGGAIEGKEDLGELYNSQAFWKRVGEGAAAGAAGGTPFGLVGSMPQMMSFLKTTNQGSFAPNLAGTKSVPMSINDDDPEISDKEYSIGDTVNVGGAQLIHKSNETNVDLYGNPLEDKDGARINPLFTVMGIIEEEGKKFFVLQNRTRGAKKGILHLETKYGGSIFKKQKVKNTNQTQYQYDDDPANVDVIPKPNKKSVAKANKELKRQGYTEEDVENDPSFETEEEFVENNYNDIIEQRQNQNKQLNRFAEQEKSKDTDIINDPNDLEFIEKDEDGNPEIDIMASDRRQYDSLEGDALRDELKKAYTIQKDNNRIDFMKNKGYGQSNKLSDKQKEELTKLGYYKGDRGKAVISAALTNTKKSKDDENTTQGLYAIDQIIKNQTFHNPIIETETTVEETKVPISPTMKLTKTLEQKFKRIKKLAEQLDSRGNLWIKTGKQRLINEQLLRIKKAKQTKGFPITELVKLQAELSVYRSMTTHMWAPFGATTATNVVEYMNSVEAVRQAEARLRILKTKNPNEVSLVYDEIKDPRTGIITRESKTYTNADEIEFYENLIQETRELRREFIMLSQELSELPLGGFETFTASNPMFNRIHRRLYGGIKIEKKTKTIEKQIFSVKDGEAELSDETQDNITSIKQSLVDTLDKMGLSWVNLQFFNKYFDVKNGKQLNGEYIAHTQVVNVALNASVKNLTATDSRLFVLFHEGMHALFEQGLFTRQEEQKLREASRKHFIKKYNINKRYAGRNLTQAQLEEEGISEAFAQFAIASQVEVGIVKTLFNRILGYLLALRQAFSQNGFTTPDQIFKASQIGLVARRYSNVQRDESVRTQIINAEVAPVGYASNNNPLFHLIFNKNYNEINDRLGTTFGEEAFSNKILTNRQTIKTTGRKLQRELDAAKAANPNLIKPKDINRFSKIMNYAAEWAQTIPLFGLMFKTIQDMDEKTRDLQADFIRNMDLYIKVAKDTKAKSFLDKAHLISQEPIFVNGKKVKNNTHYRMDQNGRITFVASRNRKTGGTNPVEIKEGEVIVLEGDVAQAYEDAQLAMLVLVAESTAGLIASTYIDDIKLAIELLQATQRRDTRDDTSTIPVIAGLPDLNTISDDQIENLTYKDIVYIVQSLQQFTESDTSTFDTLSGIKSQMAQVLGERTVQDGKVNRTRLLALQEELRKINQWQQADYVPLQRHGNYYIIVRQAPNEEELKVNPEAKGKVLHYEHIEADLNPATRETQFAEVRQRLRDEYADMDNVTIEDIEKINLPQLRQIFGNELNSIESASQYLSETTQQKFADVRKEMKSQLGSKANPNIAGFDTFVTGRQEIGGVNGFDGDFVRGILNFGLMGSEQASRNRFLTEISDRRTEFNKVHGEGTNIRQGVDKWFEYKVNDPVQEFAQLRRAGFWFFLGGNLSSAVLQTMSLVQFTGPVLSEFSQDKSAAKALSVAFKDVMKMTSFTKNQHGDIFLDFSKVPLDVREEVMHAVRTGIIKQGQLLQEIGMPVGHPTVSKSAEGTLKRNLHDFEMTVVGGAFNTMETVSRMTAYIAALRLAKDPKVLGKANEVYQGNGLWEAMRFDEGISPGGAPTPQMLAQFIVDRTFGLYGKLNRNNIGRGYGSVIFLFTTYIGQMFALLHRSLTSGETEAQKRAGRRMFTKMIIMIGITGGYMALPGVDDAEDFFSWVMSQVTGVKRDYGDQFRDMISETFGPNAAEYMQNGVFNGLGIDIQRRIGFGQLPGSQQFKALMSLTGLSTGANPKDIGGAPMAMVFGSLEKVIKELKSDGVTSLVPFAGRDSDALVSLFPTAVQNMYKAAKYGMQGYADTNRGTLLTHDLSALELLAQAAGFAPNKIAKQRDALYREQQIGGATSEYRTRMNSRITQAIQDIIIAQTITHDSGRADAAQDRLHNLMRDVMKFNQKHGYIYQYIPDIDRLQEEAMKKIFANYRLIKGDQKKRAVVKNAMQSYN